MRTLRPPAVWTPHTPTHHHGCTHCCIGHPSIKPKCHNLQTTASQVSMSNKPLCCVSEACWTTECNCCLDGCHCTAVASPTTLVTAAASTTSTRVPTTTTAAATTITTITTAAAAGSAAAAATTHNNTATARTQVPLSSCGRSQSRLLVDPRGCQLMSSPWRHENQRSRPNVKPETNLLW
jgi:hypothetical protein